jgi:HAE1 family hydrophobic/amphiphilic exporter-1
LGYTINSLTLFSLILSLGILVDASIVITESINVKIEAKMAPLEAAIETIHEHQMPLIAGVMTTVFAFLPMLLTGGLVGEFIKSIPITVSIVLISSLFVSLGIVTSISIQLYSWKSPSHKIFHSLDNLQVKKKEIEKKVQKWYKEILESFLENPKAARNLYAALILGFFISVSLPSLGLVEVVLFPPSDNDTVYINISQPIGTTLSETKSVVEEVELVLLENSEIDAFVTNIGSSTTSGSALDGSGLSDAHLASFVIQLNKEREKSSLILVDELYEELSSRVDVDLQVLQPTDGPGDAAPVEIRIIGDNLSDIDSTALQIENLLESIDGTRNIANSLEDTNGEFQIEVDRQLASLYGVNMQQVASVLNSAISGSTATTLRVNGDDIDVLVKYDFDPTEIEWNRQVSLSEVLGITVSTPSGEIPISSFADVYLNNSRSSVAHLDGDRIMKVSSYVETGIAPASIFAELTERLSELYIPEGVSIQMGGEQEDIAESFQDLARAFVLAVFLIAGLLVLQFNSYRQPLFILASIPFSLIGVLPGLMIINQPLSFPGFIGVVALSGIVVNDAIILIDQINQNRLEGMDKTTAIKTASQSRLQPILLTTITTVCGMIPLAISSDTWGLLAYSIIFGLLFATGLTLIVIPLLYQRFGEDTLSVRHR